MTTKSGVPTSQRPLPDRPLRLTAVALAATLLASGCESRENKLKMTWFGVANWTLEYGQLNVLIDGYMSRIPQEYFSGGGGGLGLTKAGFPIDTRMVDRMHAVLRTNNPVKYLLTGHSHFDHSFDTPYWAKATGAHIIGAQSTCYQAQALGVPREQCTPVYGGETFHLSDAVTMRVVLWNHSGSHDQNAEQHDPVELRSPPKPDANGNLRGGVAEDFPNGGGNRGYLFAINSGDRGGKVTSLFWTNSGSATDLHLDTIVDGKNYGSPLQSLSEAMRALGLESVDLWIAGGGESVARLVVPLLRPAAYIPNHLGDFYHPFLDGYDVGPFTDPGLKKFLDSAGITLVAPVQYLDRMDLDRAGVTRVPNGGARGAFGLPEIPVTKDAGAPDAGVDGIVEGVVSKIDGAPGPTDAAADEPAEDGVQQEDATQPRRRP